ncbi:MAG TPA: hypothetical protein VF824_07775 [Thermoanaerobaculia bacterium]|jgi:hypothetical protein
MKRAALLLLLLALPLFAATDAWWDAYQRGVAAVNAKDYRGAATALQKAIAANPQEGTNVRTGNLLVTYVPHFWLGIAKLNLGDPDGALREWRTSEDQGTIAKTEYYARMKDWVARAQAEKERLAQNAASGARKAADTAISRALATQVEALSAGGDRTDNYRAAQRKLQEALAQFNKAGTNVDAYGAAGDTAQQATALFTAAAEQGRKEKAARPANVPKPVPVQKPVQAPPQPAIQTPPVTTTTAAPPPAATATQPPPAPVESAAKVAAQVAVQQYRRAIGDAVAKSRGAAAQGLLARETREGEKLRKELAAAKSDADFQRIAAAAEQRNDALAKRLAELSAPAAKPAPSPTPAATTTAPLTPSPLPKQVVLPPPELREAWRAFAAGDVLGSEDLLTKLIASAPSAEAYLLRGCARYTKAMLSRTPDALLPIAADDFKAALRQNRSLRLDTAAFSPKLVEFFEQVRSSPR